MYVIRPFRPQGAHELVAALTVRGAAPWVSALCAIVAVCAAVWGWKASRVGAKIVLSLALIVTVVGACLTHINIFEVMFKPYPAPVFEPASAAKVDPDDKVLAVSIGGQSHAYPIRTMGYHHIVNDVIASTPVAATYCTLCHTGLIWSRVLDGRTLTFRLAGINNGNAVLRDEQTGTIWQQSTGEAIFGKLKGSHLMLVHSDELTFAQWRVEQPNGVVLKPEAQYESEYDPKDWEAHIARTHAVVDTSKTGIGPHELMLGVAASGATKAYPINAVLNAGLIQDQVGEQPIVIVVGADQTSIRIFKAKQGDDTPLLTFVRSSGLPGEIMKDLEFGSPIDFQGCILSGKDKGRCLTPIDAHKDYWFDWLNHNPSTAVFKN